MTSANDTLARGSRFIGIGLNPHVTRGNLLTFYLACFAAIMLATFIPQTQPFILEEVLQLETSRQGVVSGNLNFLGDIVIILTVGLWGGLSDRYGRKIVTALGFALISVGVLFYGLAASLWGLMLARVIYAAGIAAVSTMLITLMADYATNSSRGRATGYLGIMNGLGAMVAALFLLKLPALFQGMGMEAPQAALATYGTMAAITLVIAVFMALGLRRGVNHTGGHEPSLRQQLREGLAEGRRPIIALAYASSFVARGTAAEAVSKGGAILAISYTASLLSAPVFGLMADRWNRVTALAVSLLVGAVGYGGTFLLDNPFGTSTIICLILIGMAEVGCIITSGVLIAEQAPDRLRGSVVGFFTLSGAVGILIASVVGGHLFDHWMKTGPFVFFGVLSALVMVWALLLRTQQRNTPTLQPI
jgi:MFS family permease